MTHRIKWGDPVTGLDGVIAVAQALRDLRPVQVDLADDWVNVAEDDGLYAGLDYRIGEEVKPQEFIAGIFPGGKPVFLFDSMDEYNQWADGFQISPAFKRVRDRKSVV